MTPQFVLKKYFGYDAFRPGQLAIVNSIINQQDTLALLPTGGGKSICFQVPGLVLGGTTVVISPLISLMKDQVDTLNSKGILSTYLNSSLTQTEINNRLELMKLGKFHFVYVAPERLLTKSFITTCQNINISLLAIDEAHCISQWGHDFRPEYLKIIEFIKALSYRPPLAAFTATATDLVKQDIITSLQLRTPQIFTNSFKRDNLYFEVIKCQTSFWQDFYLLYLLKKYRGQSCVIYALTRQATEDLAELINHYSSIFDQHPAVYYHGGMRTDQRTQIQEKFIKDEIKIIVATNAFGMGVDKPNVRCVIHYHLPSNLENYYQEAGRAGRDGQPAECYLLYNANSLNINQEFLLKSAQQYQLNLNRLKQCVEYANAETCRTNFVLKYFDEMPAQLNCGNCDICTKQPLTPSSIEQELFASLFNARQQLADLYRKPAAEIMTIKIIHWLVLTKPQTKEEFLKIPGIGPGWITQWYPTIRDMIPIIQVSAE